MLGAFSVSSSVSDSLRRLQFVILVCDSLKALQFALPLVIPSAALQFVILASRGFLLTNCNFCSPFSDQINALLGDGGNSVVVYREAVVYREVQDVTVKHF